MADNEDDKVMGVLPATSFLMWGLLSIPLTLADYIKPRMMVKDNLKQLNGSFVSNLKNTRESLEQFAGILELQIEGPKERCTKEDAEKRQAILQGAQKTYNHCWDAFLSLRGVFENLKNAYNIDKTQNQPGQVDLWKEISKALNKIIKSLEKYDDNKKEFAHFEKTLAISPYSKQRMESLLNDLLKKDVKAVLGTVKDEQERLENLLKTPADNSTAAIDVIKELCRCLNPNPVNVAPVNTQENNTEASTSSTAIMSSPEISLGNNRFQFNNDGERKTLRQRKQKQEKGEEKGEEIELTPMSSRNNKSS